MKKYIRPQVAQAMAVPIVLGNFWATFLERVTLSNFSLPYQLLNLATKKIIAISNTHKCILVHNKKVLSHTLLP